jgi:transcriptional regulator with XRE-family HTH domain
VRKDVEIEPIILFGKQLRLIRKSKGLSMEKLAALSSFEYSQISRIELGQINTSLDVVFKLAKALNIEPKVLFDFYDLKQI